MISAHMRVSEINQRSMQINVIFNPDNSFKGEERGRDISMGSGKLPQGGDD